MSKMIYIVEEWEANAGGEFLAFYCFDVRHEAEAFKERMEKLYGDITSEWSITDKQVFTHMHDAMLVASGEDPAGRPVKDGEW